MAKQVLRDIKLWIAQFDLSGDHNAFAYNYGAEAQAFAAGGDVARQRLPGLKDFSFQHEGLYEAGTDAVDEVLFARVASENVVMTASPLNDGADGERCFFAETVVGNYSPTGSVGEILRFSVSGELTGEDLIRGTIMQNDAESATGSGTARQLGSVSAAQRVYAALHMLSGTGSLDVIVESDDAVGMLSPTTRISFANATGPTSEMKSAAGAITDDWWRVGFTVNSGGPFTFVVAVGIQ